MRGGLDLKRGGSLRGGLELKLVGVLRLELKLVGVLWLELKLAGGLGWRLELKLRSRLRLEKRGLRLKLKLVGVLRLDLKLVGSLRLRLERRTGRNKHRRRVGFLRRREKLGRGSGGLGRGVHLKRRLL